MSFFHKLLAPRYDEVPVQEVQVLTLAPAVMRMSVAGKDADTELGALAAAVAKLQFPQGFSAERVFAAASELARMIRADGISGLANRLTADLAPEERADALRLALVAVFCSPLRDSGDIGILAGMAEHTGMDAAEFEALFEAAKALG